MRKRRSRQNRSSRLRAAVRLRQRENTRSSDPTIEYLATQQPTRDDALGELAKLRGKARYRAENKIAKAFKIYQTRRGFRQVGKALIPIRLPLDIPGRLAYGCRAQDIVQLPHSGD